jgi:hypothetical protein
VVVNHEQLLHARLDEPTGDCPCTDAVMRHHPYECLPAEPHERGHRRDLEQIGLAENRRGRENLGRVELANVRKGLRVVRGSPCVRAGPLLAIRGKGVERNQLRNGTVIALERQLGAPKHLAAGPREWTAERKAGVDAAQGTSGSTSREPLRPSRSV